jgi:hypothetical protein
LDDEYLALDEFRLHAIAQHHECDQFVAGAVTFGFCRWLYGGGYDGDVDRFARLHAGYSEIEWIDDNDNPMMEESPYGLGIL